MLCDSCPCGGNRRRSACPFEGSDKIEIIGTYPLLLQSVISMSLPFFNFKDEPVFVN